MNEQLTTPFRPLRILHVLRAPLGGLFRHVIDLTNEQLARGHTVGLVVDQTTGGTRAAEILDMLLPRLELGVLRIPMRRPPHISDIPNMIRVDTHARALDVDVLHGHGSKGGLYARMPGFLPTSFAPIRCYTPHGGSLNHVAHPFVQQGYNAVERLLAARTDALLFESIFISNRFQQRVGDTKAMVRIVQNGISPAELVPVPPNPDAAEFLYIGELRSAKGIDTLLDATALLTRQLGRRVKLILVGSGPDRDTLIGQAETLGIADSVSFPGAMPAREAFKLGNVLVVPSRAESLPYIVLEAAGARIPMIATDVGGIGEVFGPYRNRLIECDKPDDLAHAMSSILSADPAEIAQQAADLASFVSTNFSVRSMADTVIAGYRDAAARREAPATSANPSFTIHP